MSITLTSNSNTAMKMANATAISSNFVGCANLKMPVLGIFVSWWVCTFGCNSSTQLSRFLHPHLWVIQPDGGDYLIQKLFKAIFQEFWKNRMKFSLLITNLTPVLCASMKNIDDISVSINVLRQFHELQKLLQIKSWILIQILLILYKSFKKIWARN